MGSQDRYDVTDKGKAWAWSKRVERHHEAKVYVQSVLRSEPGMPELQLPQHQRLYRKFFLEAGRELKIMPEDGTTAWWKARWVNDAGAWYVAIRALDGHTWDSALLDLCEVLAEVILGFRKPSRDIYKPRPAQ